MLRGDANDDVAQLLRQSRPAHGLEGASTAHLGEPAIVGRGLCHFHKPVDVMPAFCPDAKQFGLLGGGQDDPLRRDAGPQNVDLGPEQPHLRVEPGP